MTHPYPDENPAVEPIAVIGLSARLPGAGDARTFWDNLVNGVESLRHFTLDEQREVGVQERFLKDPNFVPAAMVLEDHDQFDHAFFGMSLREAEVRDPQHRLFLELSYTALEDAGYDPARYPGDIGVFCGVGPDGYQWLNIRSNPKAYSSVGWLAVMVGSHVDYCATLTSYKLDLRGPAFTVQTACSSSLVAVHVAVEALRNGECDMALSGGAMIEEQMGHGYVYDDGGVVSPDGHCRAFDAQGQGTIWGSGGGVVVLKRLEDALADGDHIRGVIVGNAVNNDGANKVGFSAPSAEGQAAVVAQALGVADLDPRGVTYVEAHGTGTALGDPIEVAALSNVYQRDTDERGWCGIGSVKTNIGHLGQSAGIASLLKAVLTVEHGMIPPSLHYTSPNPKIDFGKNPFYVNDTLAKWEPGDLPRRAGVSSFGIGGTNAHIVLEQAPDQAARPRPVRPAHLLQLSARTETALSATVERLAAHLAEHPELDIADVAHTLRVGRREMARRAAVAVTDVADAIAALGDAKRLITAATPRRGPRVALLFSGQGAQYAGMGAELYEHEPVFRAAVDECAEILAAELGGDFRELIFTAGSGDALRQTSHTQPALFAIEYALAVLWRSWGLEPAAMIGHSIGEYVAATLAGVFTLPDALRVVAARGRLMQSMPPGSMLAVQLDEAEVRAMLPDGLAVATVNGPGTCVVAGPTALVDQYAASLADQEVSATLLHTSHAFHSPMMDPILGEFHALLAGIELSPPRLPFLSNATGTWITAEDATDPSYWARHIREAVRFGDCVATLEGDGDWLYVECGPGRQLAQLTRTQLSRDAVAPMPSLPGPRDVVGDLRTLYAAAGGLWTQGVALEGFGGAGDNGTTARRVPLPTYPWERKRAWMDADPHGAYGGAPAVEAAAPSGPLTVDDWFSVPVWRQLPPAQPAAERIERCLAFVDDASAGLVEALRAQGTEVVEVRRGADYERRAEGGYTVRPADRADYDALVTDLDLGDGLPTRIVHAWTLGADSSDVWAAQDTGFFALLGLVQAMAALDLPDPVHLDVLTAGTQDVTGDDLLHPEHATVTGLAKVVPLEMAWLTIRHIDLAVGADPATAAGELNRPSELDTAGLHEAVALRGGRRWIQGYEPAAVPDAETAAVKKHGPKDNGVYVITGGLGGIGLTLAEDLAQRVRARLVLVSRSGLPPRAQWNGSDGAGDRSGRAMAAIRRMEEAGAEVLVVAADVTDPGDLRRVRAETLARFGRVDGIVHAAGVPGGGMAEVKERAAAELVMAPKLAGTLALREAFGDLDLDVVLLCSSITAVTGGFGQVDYCAANAFLDAHARSAHGWGAEVLSVGWGAWLEVGMAAEVAAPEAFRALQRGESAGTPIDHPIITELHPAEPLPWCGGTIAAGTHWVLDEHRIGAVPVLPGTGHLEAARRAAEAALPGRVEGQQIELRDVVFVDPIAVPDGASLDLRAVFDPEPDGAEFQLVSAGRTHSRGTVAWHDPGPPPVVDLDAVRARCPRTGGRGGVPLTGLLTVGPHWDTMRQWYAGDSEALALLEVTGVAAADLDRWVLHPSMLDEATSFVRFSVEGHYLPLSYGRVVVRGPMTGRMWSHMRYRDSGTSEVLVADISLLDEDGREIVAITEFVLRRIDPDAVMGTLTAAPAEQAAAAVTAGPADDRVGIAPADGADAFRRLLASPLGPQVVVTAAPLAEALAGVRGLTTETVEDELAGGAAADRPVRSPGDGYVAPRNELEGSVVALFGEVLGGDDIGVEDDFFEMGGNSLVAVQLIALIRKQLGVRLPMQSLFEEPTAAGVAALITQSRAEAGAAEEQPEAAPAPIPRQPRRSGLADSKETS